MSLLERIAERQGQRAETTAQGQQAMDAEAAAPSAVDQAKEMRSNYSQSIVQGRDQDIGEEQPSPEEQEQFTKAERALAELVYGTKGSSKIASMVMQANDPVEGVGKASADIVGAIEKKFPGMSEDVLFGIGESAVEQVVELIESTDDSINMSADQMAEALSIGISAWGENNPGRIDGDMMGYMAEEPPEQL